MELLENAPSWDRWHLNFEAKKFLPTKDVQLSFKAGWPRILARQFLESTMSFCKFDTAHPPSPLQCYLHCPVFAIKLVHLIESLALCSQVLLTHFCLDCSYSKYMHPWLLPDFWKPPKCWFCLCLVVLLQEEWLHMVDYTMWLSKVESNSFMHGLLCDEPNFSKDMPTWVYLCKSMIHCNNHCWVEHISKYAANQFVNKIKISIQLWR